MGVGRQTMRLRMLLGLGLWGILLGVTCGLAHAAMEKPKVMIVIDEKVGGVFGRLGTAILGALEILGHTLTPEQQAILRERADEIRELRDQIAELTSQL